MFPKPKLKTYRVNVRFEGVDHVYLVKAENSRRAKRTVFNTVPNPPWQPVLAELRAQYPSSAEFTGYDTRISWGIVETKDRCGKAPQWLYSFDPRTGGMAVPPGG